MAFAAAAHLTTSHNLVRRISAHVTRACQQLGMGDVAEHILEMSLQSLSGGGRDYHDVSHGGRMALYKPAELQHFFKDAQLTKIEQRMIMPFLPLAGVLHDEAYLKIDGGLNEKVAAIVARSATIEERGAQYAVLHDESHMSPEGRITNAVFGFSSSENIYQFDAVGKKGGVNEYLSALPFAYHLMGADRETVKFDELDINTQKSMAIACAIVEGTIPFRPDEAIKKLYERLMDLKIFSDREARIIVKTSVMFGNRDVDDFCGPLGGNYPLKKRFLRFMQNGWKLMPEGNVNFRNMHYSPSEFRQSLVNRQNFMDTLKPEVIFHSFDDYPPHAEMKRRQDLACVNLRMSDQYMKAKIVSASIVDAVAHIVDPDGNASLRTINQNIVRRLPKLYAVFNDYEDRIVYAALKSRGDNPTWEIPGSPIAHYLMGSLGKDGMNEIFEKSKTWLTGKSGITDSDYREFLKYVGTIPEIQTVIMKLRDIARDQSRGASMAEASERYERFSQLFEIMGFKAKRGNTKARKQIPVSDLRL